MPRECPECGATMRPELDAAEYVCPDCGERVDVREALELVAGSDDPMAVLAGAALAVAESEGVHGGAQ